METISVQKFRFVAQFSSKLGARKQIFPHRGKSVVRTNRVKLTFCKRMQAISRF